MNESERDSLDKLWEQLGMKGKLRGYDQLALQVEKELLTGCTCLRCQSLRSVKASVDDPVKAAARIGQPWRWYTIVSMLDGKMAGACFAEGQDADEALYRALFARNSPGGDEFVVTGLKVGFIPFGRWTGRPLSPEDWEKFNSLPTEQIGVQLDE